MEQNNEHRVRGEGVRDIIVLFLLLAGIVFMGVRIRQIEFSATWKFWIALVLGEIAYLYSAILLLCAIGFAANEIREGENKIGIASFMTLVGASAIFQMMFWGVVLRKVSLFIGIIVICAINVLPLCYLIREGRKED